MNRIVRKAGIASLTSSKSMSFTGVIINNPTRINAGDVAALGTDKNSGERNNDTRKRIATVRLVSPVRPPSETPAEDST